MPDGGKTRGGGAELSRVEGQEGRVAGKGRAKEEVAGNEAEFGTRHSTQSHREEPGFCSF